MIELIFALVIMGIVVMSAPSLLNTAAKSSYVAIQQEAINEAATKVNMIMGYHWDENDSDENFLDPILFASAGAVDLNESNITHRRIGTPIESYRTFVRADGTTGLSASPLSSFGNADSGEAFEDDMDDFHGSSSLFFTGETSTSEYIEDNTTIRINTTISYNDDTVTGSSGYNQSSIQYDPFKTPTGGTPTNIKEIQVQLTSSSGMEELEKTIILRAFSCNIGGYRLEERDF